jgi:mannose-1-phosphate guanylyltransferase/phosphomannomutase
MMRAASEEDVAFVGGTLGGAIFTNFFFAVDGMFTVAKTLEMLAVLGKNLGEVASDMPRHAQARSQVFCRADDLGKVMRRAMGHAQSMKKVLIDGIKFYPDGDRSWILILPEKERPYCSIIADAETENAAKDLSTKYASLVEKWRESAE